MSQSLGQSQRPAAEGRDVARVVVAAKDTACEEEASAAELTRVMAKVTEALTHGV